VTLLQDSNTTIT